MPLGDTRYPTGAELGRVPGCAALRRGRVLRARARGASPFATATGLSPPIRVTPAHALFPPAGGRLMRGCRRDG